MSWEIMKEKGREVQTEAIILHSRTVGEDDILIEFLTPGAGRLVGVARHGRKSLKRFGTVLETFNLVSLRYQDRGTRVFLMEAGQEGPPFLSHLSGDLSRLIAAFYFIDVVREAVPERDADPPLYELLKKSLLDLGRGETPAQVLEDFERHFLDLSGYHPELKTCLSCRREWKRSEDFYFVFREGGILCRNCLPAGVAFEPFSHETLPLILSRFLEFQMGHPFKASRFLQGDF